MGYSAFDQHGRPAWNAGRKVGAKRALKQKEVWAIRYWLIGFLADWFRQARDGGSGKEQVARSRAESARNPRRPQAATLTSCSRLISESIWRTAMTGALSIARPMY